MSKYIAGRVDQEATTGFVTDMLNIDATTIREFTTARCQILGIKVPSHLPLIDIQTPKSAPKAAERSIIQYALNGLADSRVNPKKILNWLKDIGLVSKLEKRDLDYIDRACDGRLDKQDIVDLSWKIESHYVLVWYLGKTESIPPFDTQASMSRYYNLLPPEKDASEFVLESNVIPINTFYSEVDYYYCVHHAISESNVSHEINSIIVERRRALEWIASSDGWYETAVDT